MANIIWPSEAIPREFNLSRYTKVVRNVAIFGRKGQNIDMLNDRWLASVQIAARDADTSPILESFVNKLKAGASTVECYHFGRPEISGLLLSDMVTSTNPQGSEYLNVSAATGSTLKAGDMLGVSGLLLQVAFDCTAVSNAIQIPLTIRLRKPLSSGITVVTSKPTTKFRLSDIGSTTYGPGATIRGISLNLAEDIT